MWVALSFAALAAPVHAEIVLSDLIVDLQPGKQVRDDVEVWNNSPDRSYIAVEPREIVDPGTAAQAALEEPDPQKLGLLVSPTRMILEPGQRKLLRVAVLSPESDRERVYRIMVKPVVGDVQAKDSGLKILVGYDVLVLVRPAQPRPQVAGQRAGRKLTFTNRGNVSVELIDGQQCRAAHAQCSDLPGKRLYPNASWTVELPADAPAEYALKSPGKTERHTY